MKLFRNTLDMFYLRLLLLMVILSMATITNEAKASMAAFGAPDSIIINKSKVSRKCTISIYPNASHEVLFFSATGKEGKLFDLFIFDMEGKLMKRTQVRNRETTLIATFEKGNYFFEVFSNDERIENGNMTIN